MRARRPPLSNRERNIQHILYGPPPPTLMERVRRVAWAVEEWWCRHVKHRELYRRLDGARIVVPPELDTSQFCARALGQLAEDFRSFDPTHTTSPEEGPHAS